MADTLADLSDQLGSARLPPEWGRGFLMALSLGNDHPVLCDCRVSNSRLVGPPMREVSFVTPGDYVNPRLHVVLELEVEVLRVTALKSLETPRS